ncbi:TPA: hypothetical protein DEP86_03220 [Candidatus Uhrbacteria bacterium]|nr:hypothetical protein [Candidatus Uhrbacteria bacterium]
MVLDHSLWTSLQASFFAGLGARIWDNFRSNFETILWLYLQFVLTGKQEEASRLAPLVRISAQTPPICWLEHHTNVILVPVA